MFQRCLLACLCGVLLSAAAVAAPVRLVSGPDYVPFADPSLPSGGLAGALVQAAFAATGLTVEPVQFEPWKRAYADALAGEFDAAFPFVQSAQRETEMLFSDAIYDIVMVALFRADSGHDYATPSSLAGLSLCLPLGYAPAAPLAGLIEAEAIHVEHPASPDLCLKQLAEGRVDVYVGADDLIDQRVAALFGTASPFRRGRTPVYHQSLYLLAARASHGSADLVRRFNEGLASLRADGRYDEIVRHQLQAAGG
ncbi:MAG TPA: transporter substrate-binding domain-containing protein [Aliidongia sp.]|nr:transporter substrate-binding domain-containing protein [Aliidongia sp.]